jgi:taurine dioxygenase
MTSTLPHTDVALDVTPLSAHIGAELRGIDLRSLSDAEVAAIRAAWLEHKVVFFPDQHLEPAEHLAFAARLGEPTEGHPIIPGLAEHPEVFEIDYTQATELAALYGDVADSQGLSWHTDVTFVRRPPAGSILRAVVIPDAGGDTLFSNQQAAYEGLSPSLQDYLSTLTAVHDGRPQFTKILELVGEGTWEGQKFTSIEPVEHPVVIRHPETGNRVLFVNPGFTSHIAGLSRSESDALLGFLYAHSVRPEYVVRYHWRAGTLGFWDNFATQHSVVGDYGSRPRVIQRVTLRGTAPAA